MVSIPDFPSFGSYEPQQGSAPTGATRAVERFEIDGNFDILRSARTAAAESNEVGVRVGNELPERIYLFRAERFNAGACRFGNNATLSSNAQNLAEVVNILQQNPDRFAEFNRLVHQVIPQIQWISVRPLGGEQVEIVVWNHHRATQREDLAIPLAESGTGVGQVLAILYVVLTSNTSRTIIIDGP